MEVDPWNYPFPQRNQTMSLQSITNQDVGFRKVKIERLSNNLISGDIQGAQSILPGYKYHNKTSFVNRVDDIDGCHVIKSKMSQSNFNKPSFLLKNDDIKGTKPQIVKFQTTRTPTNPLVPSYKLPYAEIRVSTPPKFIRDNIQVDDIDGARPKPNNYLNYTRQNYVLEDIEGSHPKKLFLPKDYNDSLRVKDINEMGKFQTKRVTDPLNPSYVHRDDNNQLEVIGDIMGNKSKQLHPVNVNKIESQSLRTQDISNAWADSFANNFLHRESRKDFRNTLVTNDVPGASVGSLKKGIQTKRQLNPLVPKYNFPGETQQQIKNTIDNFSSNQINSQNNFQQTQNQQRREQSLNPSQNQSKRQSEASNFSQKSQNKNLSTAQRFDSYINK